MPVHKNPNPPQKRKNRDFEDDYNIMYKGKKYKCNPFDFLPIERYMFKECGGQGNCFFLVISFLLGNKKKMGHLSFRIQTCDYIEEYLLEEYLGFIYDKHPIEHINNMRKSKHWQFTLKLKQYRMS